MSPDLPSSTSDFYFEKLPNSISAATMVSSALQRSNFLLITSAPADLRSLKREQPCRVAGVVMAVLREKSNLAIHSSNGVLKSDINITALQIIA